MTDPAKHTAAYMRHEMYVQLNSCYCYEEGYTCTKCDAAVDKYERALKHEWTAGRPAVSSLRLGRSMTVVSLGTLLLIPILWMMQTLPKYVAILNSIGWYVYLLSWVTILGSLMYMALFPAKPNVPPDNP